MTKTTISARIDSTLAENLKLECKLQNVSQRQLIESALTAYLVKSSDPSEVRDLRQWQDDVDSQLSSFSQWGKGVEERLAIALEKLTDLAPPKARRKIRGSGKGFDR